MKAKPLKTCFFAFTLVDVTVALVILTILASIAALSLRNGMEGAWIRSATDRVIGDLNLVRTAAQRDQAGRAISFTPASCKYEAANIIDPETNAPLSVMLNDYHIRQMSLSGFNTDFVITFDARGFADANAVIKLRCGRRISTIQVKKTGQIEEVN